MFPALETELKQETLPDPYEDFMYYHLQYYGYYKAQRSSLPNSATHQHVWKNNPRYLLSGSFGKREDLIPDRLQKEKRLWPSCLPSTGCRQTGSLSRDSLMLSSPFVKSRQLLYDDIGEVNPRLREPRDLFAFFSDSALLQAPRWPIECEVIKERIHHIGNVTYVSCLAVLIVCTIASGSTHTKVQGRMDSLSFSSLENV